MENIAQYVQRLSHLSEVSSWLVAQSYTQLAVLADEHTAQYCYPLLAPHLPPHWLIQIPAGECYKHLDTCQYIWQELTAAGLDRHACLLNLGGGVIGDMGGFCAATYKRGIDFIQMPTTLLSQVDASIGGKLGVDFQGFKNHIGVFALPVQVWVYEPFLATLPLRELRSGFAEVVKHCLIADRAAWQRLCQLFSTQDFTAEHFLAVNQSHQLITHSIRLKHRIATADPTERGLRKILNFGHTLGHAIESHYLTSPNPLLHGEAIALGMMAEAYLSRCRGFISADELAEIRHFLRGIFTEIAIQAQDIEAIAALTLQDKKNKASEVKAALLAAIGEANYDQTLSQSDIHEALQHTLIGGKTHSFAAQ